MNFITDMRDLIKQHYKRDAQICCIMYQDCTLHILYELKLKHMEHFNDATEKIFFFFEKNVFQMYYVCLFYCLSIKRMKTKFVSSVVQYNTNLTFPGLMISSMQSYISMIIIHQYLFLCLTILVLRIVFSCLIITLVNF